MAIILSASRTHPLRPQPQERQQLRKINQPLGLVPLRISQRCSRILLVEQLLSAVAELLVFLQST
jgi:hypothetical protein